MRYLFILNPAAGKQDCTVQLIPQLQQAAVRAGIPVDAVATCKTEYAGHAKALARAAAEEAAKAGEQLHIWTAGGDGTLVEALTGVQGFANAAVGCLPYGSGNDFLRTYGTREEFTDLDAQLAGGEVTIDTMQTNLGLSATICAAGLDAQVPMASRSSGVSPCAAARWPTLSPLWSSSVGRLVARSSMISTAKNGPSIASCARSAMARPTAAVSLRPRRPSRTTVGWMSSSSARWGG